MRQIILIAHNLRSCHNVGSLLRTAEGLGVAKVYLTGYTPYPIIEDDPRMPHLALKLDKQIRKTALGAEKLQEWKHVANIHSLIKQLKGDDYKIVGLEQTSTSTELPMFKPPNKMAILLGSEVEGISKVLLANCDSCIEIPMYGKKESFNVVQASAMMLYHCIFFKS